MSLPIMPPMPLSMAAGLKKSPRFNTLRQKGTAGVNAAVALMPYPCWDFEWSLDNIVGRELLPTSVVAQFFGTYMATAGGAGLFLFSDPVDNAVTGAQFGTGDGTSTKFQLSRNIYGAVDIIQNLNETGGAPQIYVGGSLTSPTSISSTGVVTFSSAPADAAVLTWTGQYYFACRFAEDTIDATRVFSINNGLDHWMIQGVKFSSEFLHQRQPMETSLHREACDETSHANGSNHMASGQSQLRPCRPLHHLAAERGNSLLATDGQVRHHRSIGYTGLGEHAPLRYSASQWGNMVTRFHHI